MSLLRTLFHRRPYAPLPDAVRAATRPADQQTVGALLERVTVADRKLTDEITAQHAQQAEIAQFERLKRFTDQRDAAANGTVLRGPGGQFLSRAEIARREAALAEHTALWRAEMGSGAPQQPASTVSGPAGCTRACGRLEGCQARDLGNCGGER